MKLSASVFLALTTILIAGSAQAESYQFKVKNTTKTKIVKLLVSEDGKTWGPFDLGGGIAPGENATMVWDESTNNEDCKQHVKAVYADKTETESAIFDFCEADLELEF